MHDVGGGRVMVPLLQARCADQHFHACVSVALSSCSSCMGCFLPSLWQWQLFCSVQPEADELPFAVALELHRRGSGCARESSSGSHSPAQQSSYQLHYVLQGQAQVPTCLNGLH